MKQTNNAIKFLMAQYRAIFKNAYFKGIASAVLLTAGLAAGGNAQATAFSDTDWSGAATDSVFEITGDSANDGTDGKYENLTVAAGNVNNPANITFNIIGGDSGAASATIGPHATNALTVNATGTTINLNKSASKDVSLTVTGSGAAATTTVNLKAINVTNGTFTVAKYSTVNLADAITLSAAEGGIDNAKVSFTGASSAEAGSLVGKLTTDNSGGKLDFTGFGTLKTYTDDNGANVYITVSGEIGATLDLSANDDPTKRTLKLVGGTFDLNSHATTAGNFTIKNGRVLKMRYFLRRS